MSFTSDEDHTSPSSNSGSGGELEIAVNVPKRLRRTLSRRYRLGGDNSPAQGAIKADDSGTSSDEDTFDVDDDVLPPQPTETTTPVATLAERRSSGKAMFDGKTGSAPSLRSVPGTEEFSIEFSSSTVSPRMSSDGDIDSPLSSAQVSPGAYFTEREFVLNKAIDDYEPVTKANNLSVADQLRQFMRSGNASPAFHDVVRATGASPVFRDFVRSQGSASPTLSKYMRTGTASPAFRDFVRSGTASPALVAELRQESAAARGGEGEEEGDLTGFDAQMLATMALSNHLDEQMRIAEESQGSTPIPSPKITRRTSPPSALASVGVVQTGGRRTKERPHSLDLDGFGELFSVPPPAQAKYSGGAVNTTEGAAGGGGTSELDYWKALANSGIVAGAGAHADADARGLSVQSHDMGWEGHSSELEYWKVRALQRSPTAKYTGGENDLFATTQLRSNSDNAPQLRHSMIELGRTTAPLLAAAREGYAVLGGDQSTAHGLVPGCVDDRNINVQSTLRVQSTTTSYPGTTNGGAPTTRLGHLGPALARASCPSVRGVGASGASHSTVPISRLGDGSSTPQHEPITTLGQSVPNGSYAAQGGRSIHSSSTGLVANDNNSAPRTGTEVAGDDTVGINSAPAVVYAQRGVWNNGTRIVQQSADTTAARSQPVDGGEPTHTNLGIALPVAGGTQADRLTVHSGSTGWHRSDDPPPESPLPSSPLPSTPLPNTHLSNCTALPNSPVPNSPLPPRPPQSQSMAGSTDMRHTFEGVFLGNELPRLPPQTSPQQKLADGSGATSAGASDVPANAALIVASGAGGTQTPAAYWSPQQDEGSVLTHPGH